LITWVIRKVWYLYHKPVKAFIDCAEAAFVLCATTVSTLLI
jgi:hypothetical protein